MLKPVLITMLSCYILVFWLGIPLSDFLFPGDGVQLSYLKPIYLGIVFLSGLIVGCTCYLAACIEDLQSKTDDKK